MDLGLNEAISQANALTQATQEHNDTVRGFRKQVEDRLADTLGADKASEKREEILSGLEDTYGVANAFSSGYKTYKDIQGSQSYGDYINRQGQIAKQRARGLVGLSSESIPDVPPELQRASQQARRVVQTGQDIAQRVSGIREQVGRALPRRVPTGDVGEPEGRPLSTVRTPVPDEPEPTIPTQADIPRGRPVTPVERPITPRPLKPATGFFEEGEEEVSPDVTFPPRPPSSTAPAPAEPTPETTTFRRTGDALLDELNESNARFRQLQEGANRFLVSQGVEPVNLGRGGDYDGRSFDISDLPQQRTLNSIAPSSTQRLRQSFVEEGEVSAPTPVFTREVPRPTAVDPLLNPPQQTRPADTSTTTPTEPTPEEPPPVNQPQPPQEQQPPVTSNNNQSQVSAEPEPTTNSGTVTTGAGDAPISARPTQAVLSSADELSNKVISGLKQAGKYVQRAGTVAGIAGAGYDIFQDFHKADDGSGKTEFQEMNGEQKASNIAGTVAGVLDAGAFFLPVLAPFAAAASATAGITGALGGAEAEKDKEGEAEKSAQKTEQTMPLMSVSHLGQMGLIASAQNDNKQSITPTASSF